MTNEQKKKLDFWRDSARRNLQSADDFIASNHYDWALFVDSLAIEKLLKALAVHQDQPPLISHDLNRLANQINLQLPPHYSEWLDEITKFNIEARHDNIKLDFYHKANEEYATLWHQRCKEILHWLEPQLD